MVEVLYSVWIICYPQLLLLFVPILYTQLCTHHFIIETVVCRELLEYWNKQDRLRVHVYTNECKCSSTWIYLPVKPYFKGWSVHVLYVIHCTLYMYITLMFDTFPPIHHSCPWYNIYIHYTDIWKCLVLLQLMLYKSSCTTCCMYVNMNTNSSKPCTHYFNNTQHYLLPLKSHQLLVVF